MKTAEEIETGHEHFYFLERNNTVEGLITTWYPNKSCEIWGRALHTLFYHSAGISFEDLKMGRPSLVGKTK